MAGSKWLMLLVMDRGHVLQVPQHERYLAGINYLLIY